MQRISNFYGNLTLPVLVLSSNTKTVFLFIPQITTLVQLWWLCSVELNKEDDKLSDYTNLEENNWDFHGSKESY
jgi:hypothetical protein